MGHLSHTPHTLPVLRCLRGLRRVAGVAVLAVVTSLGAQSAGANGPATVGAREQAPVTIEVARPANGSVSVTVDGRSLGAAPVSTDVHPGEHTVILRWGSGSYTQERFVAQAGDQILLRPTAPQPEPAFATIRLDASPDRPATAVFIDGTNYGPAPVVRRVPAGAHRIDVRWHDGSVSTRTWTFKGGDDVNLSAHL